MGMLGQKNVNFVDMKTDPLYQLPSIRERSLADIKDLAEHIQVCRYRVRRARTFLKIVTEQELQSHFP
jgi:transcriptional regulator with AAA-type ATPase domain